MKIGIQTWGSNGDIRPMLALASALKQAGHEVSLIVSSIDNRSYEPECQALNVIYRQVPEQIDFDLEDFAQRSFRMHPLQWLKALLNEAFFPCESQVYEAAQQLSAENDLLIGHHFLYPLKLAAKQAEKPFFSVTFCHAAIPDPAQPPFGFPNLGMTINPISWKLLDTVFNWALKKPLSRLWLDAGHAVPANILTEHLTSQTLNLVAVDPVFCPSHLLWPAHHQVCGYLDFTDDTDHWDLPDTLSQFLDNGPQPVYMTFGSVQQAVPEWSMELFQEALALTGYRAIIQTSSSRYPAGSQQGQVYFIGRHPHQPVFKRCAAVVHHGGAGTTHAATRSGCPSVVIPFMDEQLFWARRLHRLQLAGKPLPAKHVKAVDLANSLRTLLETDRFRLKAQQASIAMKNQAGAHQAVQLIERYISSSKKFNPT
jgi:UDP:flavonoid glycosyltransferase YjiC (YdhE family)